MTDFERDLAAIDDALRAAESLAAGTGGVEHTVRLAHLHVRRSGLTGRDVDRQAAIGCIDRALETYGGWPDLCLLKADLSVRDHDLRGAWQVLDLAPGVLDCSQGRAILADIALQEGRYVEAESLVAGLVRKERTWDHLVRLANLVACQGDLERADALYVAAEDEITAKSMRAYAWVQVERSRWASRADRPAIARTLVENAALAFSGYWLVTERLGDLLVEEGDIAGAIAQYRMVLDTTGRPEAHQRLASLYVRLGESALAGAHREAALATFLRAAHAGDVRYLHHLVELCADQPRGRDLEEALHWARKDVELRPNHLTRLAMARVLHRAGHADLATAEIQDALATGMRDPRLLAAASEILGPDRAARHGAASAAGGAGRQEPRIFAF